MESAHRNKKEKETHMEGDKYLQNFKLMYKYSNTPIKCVNLKNMHTETLVTVYFFISLDKTSKQMGFPGRKP